MNIFVVQPAPRDAARDLCDKHVCKMCMEGTQMLSTVLHEWGMWEEGMMKPTHRDHPATRWVAQGWPNFVWLLVHTQELYNEYERRYRKVHATRARFRIVVDVVERYVWKNGPLPHWNSHTPFAQCMPKKYQHPDPVQAYRNFYLMDKVKFAVWKGRKEPPWMREAPVLTVNGVDSGHGTERDRTAHSSVGRPPVQGGVELRRPEEHGETAPRGRRGRVDGGGKSRPVPRPRRPAKGNRRR